MQDLEKDLSYYAKFSLGDLVTSKKTGLPMYGGKIVGVMTSEFHSLVSNGNHLRWNELFENWKEKPVYVVKFPQPQRACSFEEFSKEARKEINDIDTIKTRYENLPLFHFAYYVEDDLERT